MARNRELQQQVDDLRLAQESMHTGMVQLEIERDVAMERLAALELAEEDLGYEGMTGSTAGEFSRQQLARAIDRSRTYATSHPLVKRGVRMRSEYVMGQGYSITAQDEAVQEVVDAFAEWGKNSQVLFGHQATLDRARQLDVDGSVFFALHPNRLDGSVKVRNVPVDQVVEIITDPDDSEAVWYYHREWSATVMTPKGRRTTTHKCLHPAWDYEPHAKPSKLMGLAVRWEAPMYMARTGSAGAIGFGVPDTYAALAWSLAYQRFLEDFASVARSLSMFAYKMRAAKGKSNATKQALGTTLGTATGETNPPPLAGSTMVTEGADVDLQPIPKSGATLDIDSGKPLRLMVGASLDLPDTILSGDADQGSLATAHSLDRPTELTMGSRQQLWGQVIADLCAYAIEWSIRAPGGQLSGKVLHRPDGTKQVELAGVEGDLEVLWPPLVEHEMAALFTALDSLAGMKGVDKATVLRLAYQALGVRDPDALIDQAELDKPDPTPPPSPFLPPGQPVADDGGEDDDTSQAAESALDLAVARLLAALDVAT